jgi:hypothetical protein
MIRYFNTTATWFTFLPLVFIPVFERGHFFAGLENLAEVGGIFPAASL